MEGSVVKTWDNSTALEKAKAITEEGKHK